MGSRNTKQRLRLGVKSIIFVLRVSWIQKRSAGVVAVTVIRFGTLDPRN